jgi:hypothetical protein
VPKHRMASSAPNPTPLHMERLRRHRRLASRWHPLGYSWRCRLCPSCLGHLCRWSSKPLAHRATRMVPSMPNLRPPLHLGHHRRLCHLLRRWRLCHLGHMSWWSPVIPAHQVGSRRDRTDAPAHWVQRRPDRTTPPQQFQGRRPMAIFFLIFI